MSDADGSINITANIQSKQRNNRKAVIVNVKEQNLFEIEIFCSIRNVHY